MGGAKIDKCLPRLNHFSRLVRVATYPKMQHHCTWKRKTPRERYAFLIFGSSKQQRFKKKCLPLAEGDPRGHFGLRGIHTYSKSKKGVQDCVRGMSKKDGREPRSIYCNLIISILVAMRVVYGAILE